MSVEIITTEDLNTFKTELLGAIQKLLESSNNPTTKNWLRTKEVMELLNISAGTLQNYRINGTLKFSRVGKTIYYSRTDIEEILKQNNTS